MASLRPLFARLTALVQACQQMVEGISRAAGRLFSPTDDDYPTTGVQPFEGEIPDAHQRDDSSW